MKRASKNLSRRYFLITFLFLKATLFLQAANSYFFYVQLTDKNNTSYSLSNPSQFLSARAIARRASFGLSCDSTDLPVNDNYVNQISGLGIKVHSRSKWMNGVTVWVNDSSIMSQVRALNFVKWVQYTGLKNVPVSVKSKIKNASNSLNYGTAIAQINQLNGSYLHNLGYTGKDIYIGILDAGFYNVNNNIGFDSLRLQNRLLGTKDIIEPTSNIYAQDSHGANVLSIITGNLPGQYLGTAPHASFWLIRTEYVPTEYLVETDYWVAGIEFADSVGIDVVNSSLGYTLFEDASMNYTYANMNGTYSRASKAANLASKKGIIVCNSAGNDGTKAWHYIGAPADADGILSVGSVTSAGLPSSFSSFGPCPDFRIKPEVCATGTGTAYIFNTGVTSSGNGTSYSSPLIAGMMACFLQYIKANYPGKSIPTIIQSVLKSATNYSNPTDQLGYGIPNFQQATASFATNQQGLKNTRTYSDIIYDKNSKLINILLSNTIQSENNRIRIYSVTGKLMLTKTINSNSVEFQTENFSKGIYAICIIGKEFTETHKIIID